MERERLGKDTILIKNQITISGGNFNSNKFYNIILEKNIQHALHGCSWIYGNYGTDFYIAYFTFCQILHTFLVITVSTFYHNNIN